MTDRQTYDWKFGGRSQAELTQVHEDLVRVHDEALPRSPVDYGIIDGARTRDEQRELVNAGASFTMESRHLLTGDPPLAKATDAVPFVRGKYRWEWGPIYKMATAILSAARDLDVALRWGGVWDRASTDLDLDDLEGEVLRYVGRRQRLGRRVFLDGPHFELPRETHP